MRIQQLHYIIKIVETGSMNEAAKQLFITQPSLSNAVRDLEREMGIDIFIRNPKGITLTKDGVEFLSYARQVVEQTNLLEERYKSHTETRELFSVSSQHYAFVVNAFVSLLKRADMTRSSSSYVKHVLTKLLKTLKTSVQKLVFSSLTAITEMS